MNKDVLRDRLEWFWDTFCSWFRPGIRMHVHPEGMQRGSLHTPPERRLYQRCCRCGKFRVMGKFVEMYPRGFGSWWYSCIECALDDMTPPLPVRRRAAYCDHTKTMQVAVGGGNLAAVTKCVACGKYLTREEQKEASERGQGRGAGGAAEQHGAVDVPGA